MNCPDTPARIIEHSLMRTLDSVFVLGLAGVAFFGLIGCQFVGGLDDLQLANGNANGGAGGGGNGSSNSAGNASSSVASSSGVPIMGDLACDATTCPLGPESACCSDHYHTNSPPFVECINGPPSDDGCNTAGGANGYETRIECQIPAHCPPGTICCGNIETVAVLTWYTTLSCAVSCTWPDTVACDPMNPNNDCPLVNDNGMMVQTTCATSDLLPPSYAVCK
jgi:hypothetical protein